MCSFQEEFMCYLGLISPIRNESNDLFGLFHVKFLYGSGGYLFVGTIRQHLAAR